jgi:L-ascorbate metabolism protein UlaG (beta-lactamase superfamily)
MGLGPALGRLGYREVKELDWWQTLRAGEVSITFVPSQHWSRRGLTDTNATLWGGYVLEGGGKRVYHTGDTAYFDGFRDIAWRIGALAAPTPHWCPLGLTNQNGSCARNT